MFQEKLNLKVTGALKILLDGKTVFEDHNALVANAPNIIRRALGGIGVSALNLISAYASSTLLSSRPIIQATAIATDRVELQALFDEASFNGTLDEVRLGNSAEGDFSAITGLSVTKTSVQQLQLIWTLTVEI